MDLGVVKHIGLIFHTDIGWPPGAFEPIVAALEVYPKAVPFVVCVDPHILSRHPKWKNMHAHSRLPCIQAVLDLSLIHI